MITPNDSAWESHCWRDELSQAYRTPEALLADLELGHLAGARTPFPMLVPRPFAARMQKRNPDDPLLRQVLPIAAELDTIAGFSADPLAEQAATVAPNLIQKYSKRALVIATPGCAVHCRYCFRRHFPYEDHRPNALDATIKAIATDTDLSEVILSGGDPLLLPDGAFSRLLKQLDQISHVQRIRIHTRLPIVLPQRITQDLLACLKGSRADIVVVVHCNHARELDEQTHRALGLLRLNTEALLNQSVLLKGVNDDAETQIELSEGLFAQGVLPYYLHLPDPIAGTQHFFVEQAAGIVIHEAMQRSLPGYLTPKLVKEVAGEAHKLLITRSPHAERL